MVLPLKLTLGNWRWTGLWDGVVRGGTGSISTPRSAAGAMFCWSSIDFLLIFTCFAAVCRSILGLFSGRRLVQTEASGARWVKMMSFALKTRDFVSKTKNCVSKTKNLVSIMMDFASGARIRSRAARGTGNRTARASSQSVRRWVNTHPRPRPRSRSRSSILEASNRRLLAPEMMGFTLKMAGSPATTTWCFSTPEAIDPWIYWWI